MKDAIPRKARIVLLVLVAAGLVIGWWMGSRPGAPRDPAESAPGDRRTEALRIRENARYPRSEPDSGGASVGDRPDEQLRARFQSILADLEKSSLSGDRDRLVAAAARLRVLLMENPALLEDAGAALRDPGNGLPLRRALGVVLGSLPDGAGKSQVLDALRSGALSGMERCAALALGIVPEESPPLFQRDGHPFSIEPAPGLVVFVRGAINKAETRQALAGLLASPEAEVRLAAARVLRDSMEHADTRNVMLECLGKSENNQEVRAEVAAALASTLRETVAMGAEERATIVGEIFGALAHSEEVVRFRLTAPLAQAPLDAGHRADLYALAESPDEDLRRTVVEIVGRRVQGRAADEGEESIGLLIRSTSSDHSSSVRETGALQLRHAQGDDRAAAVLVRAARQDAEPEVRAAAVSSLGAFHGIEEARDTLLFARDRDPSPMVRTAARRALGE